MAIITGQRVKQFLWKSIFCQFGIPRVLMTNNNTQFETGQCKNGAASWGLSTILPRWPILKWVGGVDKQDHSSRTPSSGCESGLPMGR